MISRVLLDVTLASDYRTRGISQTQNDPAIQAGVTLAHSSGLYLGAWSSNVDFGGGLKTRQEIDYYAGWLWQATDEVSLDVGYLKYAYPKESQFNQSEAYGILSVYGVKLGAYYSAMRRVSTASRTSLYSYVGYETELPLRRGPETALRRHGLQGPAPLLELGRSRRFVPRMGSQADPRTGRRDAGPELHRYRPVEKPVHQQLGLR
jgi:uncharacterized protein (TIGR02001 family)